jgi:hypothetical protein
MTTGVFVIFMALKRFKHKNLSQAVANGQRQKPL